MYPGSSTIGPTPDRSACCLPGPGSRIRQSSHHSFRNSPHSSPRLGSLRCACSPRSGHSTRGTGTAGGADGCHPSPVPDRRACTPIIACSCSRSAASSRPSVTPARGSAATTPWGPRRWPSATNVRRGRRLGVRGDRWHPHRPRGALRRGRGSERERHRMGGGAKIRARRLTLVYVAKTRPKSRRHVTSPATATRDRREPRADAQGTRRRRCADRPPRPLREPPRSRPRRISGQSRRQGRLPERALRQEVRAPVHWSRRGRSSPRPQASVYPRASGQRPGPAGQDLPDTRGVTRFDS